MATNEKPPLASHSIEFFIWRYTMRNIQPSMNVAKQRRKLDTLIDNAPDDNHQGYLEGVKALFEAELVAGRPTPASQFIPAYWEEFDL